MFFSAVSLTLMNEKRFTRFFLEIIVGVLAKRKTYFVVLTTKYRLYAHWLFCSNFMALD